jgi:hypothetical protein
VSVNINNIGSLRNAGVTSQQTPGASGLDETFEEFQSQMPTGDPGNGTQDMMFYLKLQQKTLAETRLFDTLSTIMKARHDVMSNSIRKLG